MTLINPVFPSLGEPQLSSTSSCIGVIRGLPGCEVCWSFVMNASHFEVCHQDPRVCKVCGWFGRKGVRHRHRREHASWCRHITRREAAWPPTKKGGIRQILEHLKEETQKIPADFFAHSPANDSTVRRALEYRIPLLQYVFYDLKVGLVDEIRWFKAIYINRYVAAWFKSNPDLQPFPNWVTLGDNSVTGHSFLKSTPT